MKIQHNEDITAEKLEDHAVHDDHEDYNTEEQPSEDSSKKLRKLVYIIKK